MAMVSTFNLPSTNRTTLLKNDDNFISEIQFEITSANAPKATISSLKGSTICEVTTYIVDTFDNNATISIGTGADVNVIMSALDIDAQTSAQYCDDGLLYNVSDPIVISITGSPTKGRALVTFKLYRV